MKHIKLGLWYERTCIREKIEQNTAASMNNCKSDKRFKRKHYIETIWEINVPPHPQIYLRHSYDHQKLQSQLHL
jgi:hypothetical protein